MVCALLTGKVAATIGNSFTPNFVLRGSRIPNGRYALSVEWFLTMNTRLYVTIGHNYSVNRFCYIVFSVRFFLLPVCALADSHSSIYLTMQYAADPISTSCGSARKIGNRDYESLFSRP